MLTGLGKKNSTRPVPASIAAPIGTTTLAAVAATPELEARLSTVIVTVRYPRLLTVTWKLSRLFLIKDAGVMPVSPVERVTFAPGGVVITCSFSLVPRITVAHD